MVVVSIRIPNTESKLSHSWLMSNTNLVIQSLFGSHTLSHLYSKCPSSRHLEWYPSMWVFDTFPISWWMSLGPMRIVSNELVPTIGAVVLHNSRRKRDTFPKLWSQNKQSNGIQVSQNPIHYIVRMIVQPSTYQCHNQKSIGSYS